MNAFKDWWRARDAREQTLLQVMALCVAAFLIYLLIYLPITNARDDLERQLEAATLEAELVASAIRESRAVSANERDIEPVTDGEFRIVISRTAQAAGITLTRLQPDQTGGLNIWADQVPSPLFYRWIIDLQDKHGIYVARASVQNTAAQGSVRAQILLKNGS